MEANGEFERTMDELTETLMTLVSTFELATSFQQKFVKVEETLRIKEKGLDDATAAQRLREQRFEIHEECTLQELENQQKELEKEQKELEKKKKELENEKDEFDVTRKDWQSTLARQQTKATEDENRISASEAKVQVREDALAKEKKEFEQKVKEFEKNQKELAEKGRMAETKEKDVNERLVDLNKRENELHHREQAVVSLEKSIKETESVLKSRLAEVEDRESMNNVTEADLQEKGEKLEKARISSEAALVEKEMELQRLEDSLKQRHDLFKEQAQRQQRIDLTKCHDWEPLDSYLARMEDEESFEGLQPTIAKIFQLGRIVGKSAQLFIKVTDGLIMDIGASTSESETLATVAKGCGYNIAEGITSLRVDLFRTVRGYQQAMNKSQLGSRAPSVTSFHVA